MSKYSNDQVLKMMSLSEEINSINQKVKQLVDDLHGASGVLGNIKELSDRLQEKVGEFNGSVENYTPIDIPTEENTAKASYASAGMKRERIVPTPESTPNNVMDYSYATGTAPTKSDEGPIEKPSVDAPVVNDVKPESKEEEVVVEEEEIIEPPKPPKRKARGKRGSRRQAPPKEQKKKESKKLFGDNTMNIDKFSGSEDDK